ncbi:protein FAM204A-like [Physella acuta]|uniref:protein FAM204A-like n=1 Tax=Physella acuta TaxID=109671 RepID=UPI0027DD40D0|nr:protein FAM204A-like [Physella acuta]
MEDKNDKCNVDQSNYKPKNVSQHLWEKFKNLEKRTNEATQRSTEKRIKHLKKQVLETVTSEFTSPEDKDIARKYDVKFGPPVEKGTKRKLESKQSSDISGASKSEDVSVLNKFLNVNSHLQLTDHSRPPPPTALEKKIDQCIKNGDFEQAESLSDHLANREFGEKIVEAIDASRYMEEQKRLKESMKAKKKKKLHWGFETKQRWETKGNM